jgi:hypothetical protein
MASNALGYNKTEYKKQVQGLAVIKSGKDKCSITFLNNKPEHVEHPLEFDNGESKKIFLLKDLPKTPTIPTNSEDTYFVKLNKDGDEVESISPADGVYTAQVMDMSRPEKDADPAPYLKKPYNPKFDEYLAFNVYWKVVEGDFKGSILNQFLHYSSGDKPFFAESKDTPGYANWGMSVTEKATWLPLLQEFCLKNDCVGKPIEWPEDGNVLPELLSRILSNKKKIKLFVKDGYVKEFVGSSERQTRIVNDDELDDEPTPKSKKATVSKAKPVAKKSAKKNSDEDL